MKKVLAIVAHSDDESFFAGGTLAQHAAMKHDVLVAVLADGVGSRFAFDVQGHAEARVVRRKCFISACKALGVRGQQLDVFPDQEADAVRQIVINRAVEDLVAGYIPDLVYTHHVGDLNLDHRKVAEAVLVATRGTPVRCMTPEWPSRCVGPKWKPKLREAIYGKPFAAKVKACLCYKAELRAYPHPRSEKAIRANHEEAFMEIR